MSPRSELFLLYPQEVGPAEHTDEFLESSMQIQTDVSQQKRAKKRSKKSSKKTRAKKKTQAELADPHALYERAVQDPKTDAAALGKLYRRVRKRAAKLMREDFCGTGSLSAAWVNGGKERSAYGVDLDRPTLDWGLENNVAPMSAGLAQRITLVEGNVLTQRGPKADIACALNFSYCCLKDRKSLVTYFKNVRKNLAKDGVFVMDVLGGSDTMGPDENRHDLGGFTYRWKQHFFDPLTHDFRCTISFFFDDGSKISPAFEYDWRLWTMPELCDALEEAGFSGTHRMWEKTDKKGNGTGEFDEPKRVENQESWWTYLIAER